MHNLLDFSQPTKIIITSKSANGVPFYLMQPEELKNILDILDQRIINFNANSASTTKAEREQNNEYVAAWQNALYNLTQKRKEVK